MKIKKLILLTIIFFMICVSFISYKKTSAFNINKQVEKIVCSMTLEEKIGQMIMLDFRQWKIEGGKKESLINLNDEVAEIIEKYNLGGILLFSENISNINQTVELVHNINQIALNDGNKNLPMLIALDQEGGMVSRLKDGTNLPGNMALGATRSIEAAYNSGYIIGRELQSLGINVNFAPVLDVNNNPNNPVIGVRSISSNANLVGELGSEIIKAMQSQGIAATAKHFPGHGDTFIDTHYGLPVVNKPLEQLKNLELKPFKNAIDEGVDMIMTAHIQFPEVEKNIFRSKLDGSEIYLPATLSKNIITNILREEMNFKGVVITDAMNMKAISDHFGELDACKLAINAGVDILLMPTILREKKDVLKLDKIFKGIVDSVKNKEIEEEKINDSVCKIINLKIKRGIIGENKKLSLQEKQYNASKIVGCKDHKDLERRISEAAITVVKNDDNILPLNP
ncbi:MAG: glycoside hydrolase family 3 protein, partial [Sarcina sp.]